MSAGKYNLYQLMFAPDLHPQTLAIIGCFVGIRTSAVAPMVEMQCRVAAKLFKVFANLHTSYHTGYRPTLDDRSVLWSWSSNLNEEV